MRAFSFLLASTLPLLAKEVTVDLVNPSYDNHMAATDSGGVLRAKDMRIQGRHIYYDTKTQTLTAQGDLLVDYGGRFFVGDKLEYNFVTHTGVVYEGRTADDLWFLGGKKILLKPDKSYEILGAYITTSENVERDWDIYAPSASVTSDSYLYAKRPKVRVNSIPILYLPSLKSDLKWQPESPVRYQASWLKGQGPRISARYRVYSWDNCNIFSRLDIRPDFQKLGIAGALEADYKEKRHHFATKNFVTKDTFFNDTDPGKESFRFRVQGLWKAANESQTFHSAWDWYNDKNLPLTFKGEDFELNTAKRTELLLRNIGEKSIAGLYFRPRINTFQGFNQELPTLNLSLKPIALGKSGIIMENRARGAYLNYVYSDDIDGLIPDFRSARLEMDHNLYRPFRNRYFTFTPLAGFTGIFYSNSPSKGDVGQAVFRYEGLVNTKFSRNYRSYKHVIEPYVHFKGLTFPTISIDDYFVYSIADGYNRLNALRPGLKSNLYSHNQLMPTVSADLYTYGFFSDNTYKLFAPKTYLDLLFHFPKVAVGAHGAWNFEESVLDYSNLSLLWTLNERLATSFEFRHRSRFDWRKDNHRNFILDVSRSIDELLESPASDGRNTFLTRLQIKLHPEWVVRLRMHQGWGRKDEPSYSEGIVDLLHMVTSSWKLRTSAGWTVRTKGLTGFTGSLKITNHF